VDYDGDEFWDNEDFEEDAHTNDMEYVMVDAHILCTPAIADIDGDGGGPAILVMPSLIFMY
jgi:hypothetical protein